MPKGSGGGGRPGRSGGGGSSLPDNQQPGEVFRAAELSNSQLQQLKSDRSAKTANNPIPSDQRDALKRSVDRIHKLYDSGETFRAEESDIPAIKSIQRKIVNHPDLTMGQARTIRRDFTNPAIIKNLAKELKLI